MDYRGMRGVGGRSVHPSPYLRQTHNSQRDCLSVERDGQEGWDRAERDTHTHLHSVLLPLILSPVFDRYCNAHKFPYFLD